MGDFDYRNCPISLNSEDEEYDQMSKKTQSLLSKINNELRTDFEERKYLEERLNNLEKEMEKRNEVLQLCTNFCEDGTREIKKCSEKIQRFDKTISHHEEILDSWQCLIDEFRRIPEDSCHCH